MSEINDPHVVSIDHLSRRFFDVSAIGKAPALDDVSLKVKPGRIYGLVGANGSGKTTLIKHVLGLLRAQQGTVKVFGLDPVQHPVEVLQKIGYLSENRDLPDGMRIDALMRYTSAFYPQWDQDYAFELMKTFGLDAAMKVNQLSKGMRAQVGLIAAVAHRPELLLLDEPSTGLDAVVRRDILSEIIRAVADDGRSAIFSSHLLDEVELMSDYVFMIDQGKLVLEGELDDIKQQHLVMTVQFPSPIGELPPLAGLVSAEQHGDTWNVVCHVTGNGPDVHQSFQAAGGQVTTSRSASLHEIFVARVGRDRLETVEG